eukprot:2776823-Alexandrium_andersonii.AAC.1
MSVLDLEIEKLFCVGALKGAGRRSADPQSALYQGSDGARARQLRLQMRQDGRGELFDMFNIRPAPRASAEYRTHPVAMEITWGVLRGHACRVGVAILGKEDRKRLLEDSVETVPRKDTSI